MELGGPALLCIENLKGQPQVVWTPIGLCQTQTLKHSWEVRNEAWAALEPSGCVAYMGGCTCPEIGLAIVPGDGPLCLLEFRKLWQLSQPIWKCLKCTTG